MTSVGLHQESKSFGRNKLRIILRLRDNFVFEEENAGITETKNELKEI